MAVTTGITGLVRASNAEGTDLASIIGEADGDPAGTISPYSASLAVTHPVLDTTAFGSSIVSRSKILGLGSWTGNIVGHWHTGAFSAGIGSLVSLQTSYDLNIQGYNLTITSDALQYKVLGDSWFANAPGLVTWNATIDALIDSTTAVSLGAAGDTGETVTLTIDDDTAGTGTNPSFTGTCVISSVSPNVVQGDLNRVSITIEGTGDLTSVVGNDNGYTVFPAGVVGPSAATEIVVTAATGRTYTGDFLWNSISLRASPGELVDVTIAGVGTGALTPA